MEAEDGSYTHPPPENQWLLALQYLVTGGMIVGIIAFVALLIVSLVALDLIATWALYAAIVVSWAISFALFKRVVFLRERLALLKLDPVAIEVLLDEHYRSLGRARVPRKRLNLRPFVPGRKFWSITITISIVAGLAYFNRFKELYANRTGAMMWDRWTQSSCFIPSPNYHGPYGKPCEGSGEK